MKPLVSIIIPVYNAAVYLEQTLRSAIGQSWPNTEILIIDDGSTDHSLDIARGFSARNIQIYSQQNRGASAARNLGISKSSGKYIQFLDADDLLSPDKAELQVAVLEQNPGAIAVCSTVHFKDGGDYRSFEPSEYEEGFIHTSHDVTAFMIRLWGGDDFRAGMVQPNAWMTPRSLIELNGGWNEALSLDDDGEFFARMVLNAKAVIKTGGLNYYRKYPTKLNLSSQKNKRHMESALESIRLKKQYLFRLANSEAAKKAIFRQLNDLCISTYLREPGVYAAVCGELAQLPKYRYPVIIGGPVINFIARFAGWRFARRMQGWYSKLNGSL